MTIRVKKPYGTVSATSFVLALLLISMMMVTMFAQGIDETSSIGDESTTTTTTKNVIKILYCVRCGMKRNFAEVRRIGRPSLLLLYFDVYLLRKTVHWLVVALFPLDTYNTI
jgi:selT/selW/selH-like putative selenoprotein